ncbi:MAG: aldo/keto reductase [Planctomycetes bacterium]|nr:aldo/keto reductase [Planctomycetota bacterium]
MNINDHLPLPQYSPKEDRYENIKFRQCGESGLKLPPLSIGLWHNFGDADNIHNGRQILRRAFDLGITHFDLANNYGPPYGSAEENFASIFKKDFSSHRRELIISSKAGYDMWPGPYGRGGSKKYLINSCEDSLSRLGLDYLDIFYHHCPDPETPLEETADALSQIVTQGKALYIGISNYYKPSMAQKMVHLLKERGVPLLINQLRYSMFDRRAEELLPIAEEEGFGVIAFSPLEQGILTGKYNAGIPKGSRADNQLSYLPKDMDKDKVAKAVALEEIAKEMGIPMTTLALSWLLRNPSVTSVLAGVSSCEQVDHNIKAVEFTGFSDTDLERINSILSSNTRT